MNNLLKQVSHFQCLGYNVSYAGGHVRNVIHKFQMLTWVISKNCSRKIIVFLALRMIWKHRCFCGKILIEMHFL